MNIQQMMAQAQKMQREMKKAKDALDEKEFTLAKGGMVEVTMTGDHNIVKINFDEDALDPENKDMLEDTLKMCINELLEQINDAEEEINERLTGSKHAGGLF